jgi:glucose/arabinose dehydrogenase
MATCTFPSSAALAQASVPEGFCAWEWARGLETVRGITRDDRGNVLVVARGDAAVVALWDADGDGVSGSSERAELVTQSGLNHGIELHGGYLYASSSTAVFRWRYAADRRPLTNGETVIDGIPGGGHSTRTLAFDDEFLYVSVGSASNVDANSNRARIRRFPIAELGDAALPFGDGEVFADGLRNEVGLRFDDLGRLWGVENGRDDLSRADLGGDIHDDNPGEELNLFLEPGAFYGYPYCWSEFVLPDDVGMGPGTQWADPSNQRTDEWCRDPNNVVPPVLSMQAHAAPLDLFFYPGGSFPASYAGDLFVTFHGSWNREPPTGYKVMHVPFGPDGMPSGSPTPFLESSGAADDAWPHRPVGLTVLTNGVLLVTSDESDRILAVGYAPPN